MSTATGDVDGRALADLADEAVRSGRRTRAAAYGMVLSYAFAFLGGMTAAMAAPAGPHLYFGLLLAALMVVWLVSAVVGMRGLWHTEHYGHTEGRNAAILIVILSGVWTLVFVWIAVAVTGGPGAGRRRDRAPETLTG